MHEEGESDLARREHRPDNPVCGAVLVLLHGGAVLAQHHTPPKTSVQATLVHHNGVLDIITCMSRKLQKREQGETKLENLKCPTGSSESMQGCHKQTLPATELPCISTQHMCM